MFSHLIINSFFVLSVIIIWFMLGYQFLLFLQGYLYGFSALKEKKRLAEKEMDLPAISIMIPAHNEGIVIVETLESMARLEYPEGKLEVIVVNDGSKDDTAELVEKMVAKYPDRLKLFNVPADKAARGKSAALNLGLLECKHQVIGIFDADNTPQPDSILHLARQLTDNPKLGAVIGQFRCINKAKNLLTRFINLEGLAFQWIVQGGRWRMMRISTLPGTNYLIRRPLLEKLGGWDVEALAEDAEMSIRIYEEGYLIKFVPYAVTWEQEPETLKVWFKQRVRWARGNNYVLQKHGKRVFQIKPRVIGVELFYAMALYYIFFVAILLSDILFLASVTGLVSIPVPGPYGEVWFLAFGLFLMELVIALSREKEDTPTNLFLMAISYFTYCQLWIFVVLKAAFDDFVLRRKHTWAKTQRFPVKPQA
jgi:cellulose synthase/poly-beta-1,6-N-acetylglucosamine synthase-like glycosyltransferase